MRSDIETPEQSAGFARREVAMLSPASARCRHCGKPTRGKNHCCRKDATHEHR